MKNIMKKLVASVVTVGILFSGFGSVQAEEVPVQSYTYDIWDYNGPINEDSPYAHITDSMGGVWSHNIPEGRYTYLFISIKDGQTILYKANPYENYATVEEAQEGARQFYDSIYSNYQSSNIDTYSIEFIDPYEVKNNNGHAYGHDKDKAQGLAVGQDK